MAGKLSVYSANQLLNKLLRSTDFTPTASYWVSLHTGTPDAALRANNIAGASEVIGAVGYARIEVRGGTGNTFSISTAGATENSGNISYAAATASWGTVVTAALMDSATLGAGNVILYGALTVPKAVDTGDLLVIAAGLFDITL